MFGGNSVFLPAVRAGADDWHGSLLSILTALAALAQFEKNSPDAILLQVGDFKACVKNCKIGTSVAKAALILDSLSRG
jgi:hypothetical protein